MEERPQSRRAESAAADAADTPLASLHLLSPPPPAAPSSTSESCPPSRPTSRAASRLARPAAAGPHSRAGRARLTAASPGSRRRPGRFSRPQTRPQTTAGRHLRGHTHTSSIIIRKVKAGFLPAGARDSERERERERERIKAGVLRRRWSPCTLEDTSSTSSSEWVTLSLTGPAPSRPRRDHGPSGLWTAPPGRAGKQSRGATVGAAGGRGA